MLENLLNDAEAVIRQHIAGQLLQLSMIAMVENPPPKVIWEEFVHKPLPKELKINKEGYQTVLEHVIPYLRVFLSDSEVDVRRAASDCLAGLALHLKPAHVQQYCLPIALELAQEKPHQPSTSKKRTEAEQRMEELRTTACNLLAEMGGAASEYAQARERASSWVHSQVLPAVLELCYDDGFRVRRSAAQALPRVMGAAKFEVVRDQIVPAFEALSRDEAHRVRKSTGECLVDMSRALMILAAAEPDHAQDLLQLRREVLLPIADRLIQDGQKQVRQGMMQFLGPFMASFYPYQTSALTRVLPNTTESDGSHHLGVVAQFFPHASSMVARLNSSQNSILLTPTPVHSSTEPFFPRPLSEMEKLRKSLPEYFFASQLSSLSSHAVVWDRTKNPPAPDDLQAISEVLLDYFAALSVVSTGDENTDAEMRVYCAYSFPALVLLLGPDNWDGSLRTCFFTLLNPLYGQETSDEDEVVEPPLPVKRCLASSLHTVAHILGPALAARDIVPAISEFFLPDGDESVRLNIIRNFASMMQSLNKEDREAPFLVWSEIIQGESFLGGRKRSASNPVVLNWRQRNYLARSLPELILLVGPKLVREHIWPILKVLLTDTVNDVREDALWSISLIVQRCMCVETVKEWGGIENPEKFSKEFFSEVITWIFANILSNPPSPITGKTRPSNFSDRQVFCRICGSLGLALRLSNQDTATPHDNVKSLRRTLESLFPEERMPALCYESMTSAEQKIIKSMLEDNLLPRSLMMKDDRTSNVRITLMKVLQIMPKDIRLSKAVKSVLKELEDEWETWTSFGEEMENDDENKQKVANDTRETQQEDSSSGTHDEAEIPREIRTVVFEDGPIGMQLEPTKGDKACRIYGFNDFGDELSPAHASGLIEIGDVIVSVNGTNVKSYDETIDLLKSGGKRIVCFRSGTEAERYVSDEGSIDEEEEERRQRKAKKESKKSKKPKKDKHESEEGEKKSNYDGRGRAKVRETVPSTSDEASAASGSSIGADAEANDFVDDKDKKSKKAKKEKKQTKEKNEHKTKQK